MKVQMTITVDIDENVVNPADIDELNWLRYEVLNVETDGGLLLYEALIGDFIGEIIHIENMKFIMEDE